MKCVKCKTRDATVGNLCQQCDMDQFFEDFFGEHGHCANCGAPVDGDHLLCQKCLDEADERRAREESERRARERAAHPNPDKKRKIFFRDPVRVGDIVEKDGYDYLVVAVRYEVDPFENEVWAAECKLISD
ncbi:hypothetical protein D6833_09725 [Candidatus Parcubacteria bacterium]|nr:MAG: hypothetical protein D6833_09725 [Candidatus Parcubacteria bacterium]